MEALEEDDDADLDAELQEELARIGGFSEEELQEERRLILASDLEKFQFADDDSGDAESPTSGDPCCRPKTALTGSVLAWLCVF